MFEFGKDIIKPSVWRKCSIDSATGCWIWTGSLNGGYGQMSVKGKLKRVHRVFFERFCGPIPSGLEIDHTCKNKSCVNPSHLEIVTHKENVRRSNGMGGINARKTHCIRGHEFTEENTIVYDYYGVVGRQCKTCKKMRDSSRVRRKEQNAV